MLGLAWSGAPAGRSASLGLTATCSTVEGTDWSTIDLPPGSHTTTRLGMYSVSAVADGNPNPIRSSFSGGIAGHAIVPGRPLDHFGIGYFYCNFGNELQGALAAVLSFENEQGAEVYHSFALTSWCHLGGDLRLVNPASGASKPAVITGLRVRLTL